MAVAESLAIEVRQGRGKQAAKHLRQSGKIPGVVYSHGQEGIAVQVDHHAFKRVMRYHGTTGLVELEGLPGGKTLAVYKELQLHPVKYEPTHIDFQTVKADEKIAVEVKVELVGLPVGVDLHGGTLVRACDHVTLACLPADIPEFIQVDVSKLDVGHALHLGDANLPEKFTLVSPANTTLATVQATREAVSKREGDAEPDAAAPAAAAAAPEKKAEKK